MNKKIYILFLLSISLSGFVVKVAESAASTAAVVCDAKTERLTRYICFDIQPFFCDPSVELDQNFREFCEKIEKFYHDFSIGKSLELQRVELINSINRLIEGVFSEIQERSDMEEFKKNVKWEENVACICFETDTWRQRFVIGVVLSEDELKAFYEIVRRENTIPPGAYVKTLSCLKKHFLETLM